MNYSECWVRIVCGAQGAKEQHGAVRLGWEAASTLQTRIKTLGAGEKWEILGCVLKVEQAGFWHGIASVGC